MQVCVCVSVCARLQASHLVPLHWGSLVIAMEIGVGYLKKLSKLDLAHLYGVVGGTIEYPQYAPKQVLIDGIGTSLTDRCRALTPSLCFC